MATSDGISTAEWDIVHGLAVDVVNASDVEKPRRKGELLDYLKKLEVKYGELPSILATRADYLDDNDPAREELLLKAFSLAEARNDNSNVVYLAQSLAELYLERMELTRANSWLSRMREGLSAAGNRDYSEYERLRSEYRKLAITSARDTDPR
jgi:hypothetical protein